MKSRPEPLRPSTFRNESKDTHGRDILLMFAIFFLIVGVIVMAIKSKPSVRGMTWRQKCYEAGGYIPYDQSPTMCLKAERAIPDRE